MSINSNDLEAKAARLGLIINLAAPFGVAMIALILVQSGAVRPAMDFRESPLLFYVLGAVAISELAAGYFIRRIFFSPQKARELAGDPFKVEQWVLRSSIILFALGASPIIYGVVLYILGGDLKQLAFFAIISLVGYRLLRPTAGFLDEFIAAGGRA